MGKISYLIIFVFIIVIIVPLLISRGILFEGESPLIIRVYNHRTDEIVSLELNRYLKGVVAAEMPAAYHMEALKAQAVASRTYTLKQLPSFGGRGSRRNPGADISTDYRYNQAWLSREAMRDRWGLLSFFYYWSRINRAVEETRGEVLVYNNELIDAVYHSNSGGITENSEDVWGAEVPYLRSVESPYDSNSGKNFEHVIEIGYEELNEKLNTEITGTDSSPVEVLRRSDTERVLKIRIAGRTLTGEGLRGQLQLPSTKFTVKPETEKLIFHVYGNGHGVGMSQDGAHGFARQGYSYREILKHYYRGTEIRNVEDIK